MLLFDPKRRFHLLNQRFKIDLTLFLAIGVDVPINPPNKSSFLVLHPLLRGGKH